MGEDTIDPADAAQRPAHDPEVAAHPSPVDHEQFIGGTADDDLAVTDELDPGSPLPGTTLAYNNAGAAERIPNRRDQ